MRRRPRAGGRYEVVGALKKFGLGWSWLACGHVRLDELCRNLVMLAGWLSYPNLMCSMAGLGIRGDETTTEQTNKLKVNE